MCSTFREPLHFFAPGQELGSKVNLRPIEVQCFLLISVSGCSFILVALPFTGAVLVSLESSAGDPCVLDTNHLPKTEKEAAFIIFV